MTPARLARDTIAPEHTVRAVHPEVPAHRPADLRKLARGAAPIVPHRVDRAES
jgi:hypothetical protein